MAEADQSFVGNDEQQDFTVQESDQHHLSANEFDHQNFDGNVHGEFNYVGTETENQLFAGNDQTFAGDDPSSNYGVVSDQMYPQNETEHALEGGHGNGLTEDGSKQEVTGNEANETNNVADNSHPEEKAGHGNNQAGGSEKKWPGWPGESVFRMLVPAQKVGNIIGRKGEYIKKTVEETKARIKVLDGPPGSQERAVLVSAKEVPDAALPPAINGILSIHRRIVEGLDGDSSQAAPTGVKVSTKLLVPATQAGSLIGKQGATVKSIQEAAGCMVRVLGQEDLPVFALQDDRVVEIAGEPTNVHTALELVASHLRKFVVDRSIIPIFEKQMQAPSTPMEHMPPPQPWGHPHPHGLPPNAGAGRGYGPPQYMPPPPHQLESYYPPVEMPPPAERQPHQGISAYGREPQMNVHASANVQPAQSMITQVTQHMQIPLLYADAVIGTNGATISYIRRASGATVTIQESRGAPGDMTVEINGTASQVQASQQLIQNFMADAGAPPAAQTQAAATTEQAYSQGYNTYAAAAAPPATMYGAPATSTAQPATYGSVYGTGYGY